MMRLGADGLVLAIGYLMGSIPGVVVATSAVAAGVISEATYIGLRARPVLRDCVRLAEPIEPPLTFDAFLSFYIPLAMTSLLTLLVQPVGSAALSRMPQALESLAVWPVVSGLIFMFRGLGMAYNEVVVALLDEPRSARSLQRFTVLLAALTTLLLFILASTPLSTLWFKQVAALTPPLAALARPALWVALPLPGLNVLQSWYQGSIVHSRRTRGITESVGLFLLISSAMLLAGVAWGQVPGLYVGLGAFSVGGLAQTIWLWGRSRPAMRAVHAHDMAHTPLQVADTLVR